MTRSQCFASPKVHGVILYTEELIADALIQTTLESNVRALKYASIFEMPGEPPMRDLILVRRREGLFELRIRGIGDGSLRRPAERRNSKLHTWTLTEEEIMMSPKRQNARNIYNSRGVRVSVHLRMSILDAVGHRSASIGNLTDRFASFENADQAILYLAWVGALRLHENGCQIGPSTVVSAARA
jgi:hypothetical protein